MVIVKDARILFVEAGEDSLRRELVTVMREEGGEVCPYKG
jgi:hypothetical protein